MGRLLYIMTSWLFLVTPFAFAHQGHEHGKKDQSDEAMTTPQNETALFKRINERYLATVKPIFTAKCMDCHSGQTRFPWYYKIPGIQRVIDQDIREAKEHIDFSGDFPFKSHATPKEDFIAIQESIQNSSMPPLKYRMFHWDSALTNKEQEIVFNWTEKSLKELSHP